MANFVQKKVKYSDVPVVGSLHWPLCTAHLIVCKQQALQWGKLLWAEGAFLLGIIVRHILFPGSSVRSTLTRASTWTLNRRVTRLFLFITSSVDFLATWHIMKLLPRPQGSSSPPQFPFPSGPFTYLTSLCPWGLSSSALFTGVFINVLIISWSLSFLDLPET